MFFIRLRAFKLYLVCFFALLLLASIWGKYSLGKAFLLGVYTLLVAVLTVYFIDRALVSRRKRKGLPYRHLRGRCRTLGENSTGL